MNRNRIVRRLLLIEALGFTLIITISWLNELIQLPKLLFGTHSHPSWHEAAFETAVIVAAAIPTMFVTHRLAKRLAYLEGFLRVCAWCHKIGEGERWLGMEDYFKSEFKINTSHGICPVCAEKFEEHAVHTESATR